MRRGGSGRSNLSVALRLPPGSFGFANPSPGCIYGETHFCIDGETPSRCPVALCQARRIRYGQIRCDQVVNCVENGRSGQCDSAGAPLSVGFSSKYYGM